MEGLECQLKELGLFSVCNGSARAVRFMGWDAEGGRPGGCEQLEECSKDLEEKLGTDLENPNRGRRVCQAVLRPEGQLVHIPFVWPTPSHPLRVTSRVTSSRKPSLPPHPQVSQGSHLCIAMVLGFGSNVTLLVLYCKC